MIIHPQRLHKLRLLLITPAVVRPAKDIVVKSASGNFQRFAELIDAVSVIWLAIDAF